MPTDQVEILQLNEIPKLSPFADGVWWRVLKCFDWYSRKSRFTTKIPEGFVTDFASVPLPFRMVLPRWATYGPAAIVHDWLYWDQQICRESADKFILEEMEEAGVGIPVQWLIYVALRLGGWFAWRGNRKAKQCGKKRIIEKPVDGPYETWERYQLRVWPP